MGFFQYGSVIERVATTATAAGTTTLVNTSQQLQIFTGTSAQTIVLPDATTMTVGQSFEIFNQSTGTLTLEFNGGAAFTDATGKNYALLSTLTSITIVLQTKSVSAGTWAVVSSSAIVTGVVAVANGGTGLTSIPSAAISLSTTTAISANTAIPYNSKISDNYNAYNTSTFTYTIPATGQYRLSVWSPFSASAGTYWKRNGTTVSYLCDAAAASGTTSYPFTLGDTVTIYSDSSVTVTGGTGNFANFCIEWVGN